MDEKAGNGRGTDACRGGHVSLLENSILTKGVKSVDVGRSRVRFASREE